MQSINEQQEELHRNHICCQCTHHRLYTSSPINLKLVLGKPSFISTQQDLLGIQ